MICGTADHGTAADDLLRSGSRGWQVESLGAQQVAGAARGLASGLNRGFPPWPEAGSCLHTWFMQLGGNVIKPPQRQVLTATPSYEAAGRSVSDIETDLTEKADATMYEDDEDPLVAAEQLARLDPRAGAEAFLAIACDGSVDDGLRLEAAGQLPGLDRRAAAEALRAVACDGSVDDGLRLEAAGQLPEVDRQAAAEALRVIASDGSADDGLRWEAAEQLAGLDR